MKRFVCAVLFALICALSAPACGQVPADMAAKIDRYVLQQMLEGQIPGLALDMGFIGDSEFEFSFGASYAFKL